MQKLSGGDSGGSIVDEEKEEVKPIPNQKPTAENYVDSYDPKDLRKRLDVKFPYQRDSKIPKTIHQTWKDPLAEIKEEKLKKLIESWAQQEGFKHVLLSDVQIDEFLAENFSDFPEILETYSMLPLTILKYDFVRYLILLVKGGIYTDVDTSTIMDLDKWIDVDDGAQFQKYLSHDDYALGSEDVGFVVGIESDYDRADWKYSTSRRVQLCQWTFKSKSGHPILRELIHKIVTITMNNYSERLNHVKINDEYHTLHSVYTILEWTGPGIFTDTIFDHFNRIYSENIMFIDHNKKVEPKYLEFDSYHKERNTVDKSNHRYIGWNNFTRLQKPAMVDDVMILPINSFNGFIDDLEFPIDNAFTYVKHIFSGSWKDL